MNYKKLIAIATAGLAMQIQAQLATRVDQYYNDWSLINPSAINSGNKSQVSLFYNRLFTGIKGSPTNILISAIFPNPEKRLGFGINFAQEKIGFSTLSNGYVSYAYTLPVSDQSKIHAAASIGLLSQQFNPNAIDVINQDDPYYLSLQQGKPATRFDFKVSASYQYKGILTGFAAGRLTRPKFSYDYYNFTAQYDLANFSNAFISAKLKVSKDFIVQPVASLNIFNFETSMLQYGANLYVKEAIWLGVHSAGNRNIALNVGGNMKNSVKIGYSYSMPYSAKSKLLGSGHEFFTTIMLGKTSDLVSDIDYGTFVLKSEFRDSSAGTKNSSQTANKSAEVKPTPTSANVISVETISLRNDTIVINSFEEMKFLKSGYDTSKLIFKSLEKQFPRNGYYVTVGVFKNEANANRHIKNMYVKGITAYKFYMPENQYYYVYIFRSETPEEADNIKWAEQPEIPDIWTKRIFHR